MGSRRTFTKELKLSIVNELNSSSVAELSRLHDVKPDLIYRWKKEYEKNPADAFQGNGKLWKEEAQIEHLKKLVGELYAQIDLLKKKEEISTRLRAEEQRKRQYTK